MAAGTEVGDMGGIRRMLLPPAGLVDGTGAVTGALGDLARNGTSGTPVTTVAATAAAARMATGTTIVPVVTGGGTGVRLGATTCQRRNMTPAIFV